MDSLTCKPLLKWVGGKRKLLPLIQKHYPKEFSSYYEPFLGGGAVFLGTSIDVPSFLSDVNSKLMDLYLTVRDHPKDLLDAIESLPFANTEEDFYIAREMYNRPLDLVERSSLFLYLNRHSFNGVYRENKSGRYNVPYGKYENPGMVSREHILTASDKLQSATLYTSTFMDLEVSNDSFVYLDPPYHNTFAQYSAGSFREEDHLTLRNWCDSVDALGGKFLLSNSDTEYIRELYLSPKYTIVDVASETTVSGKTYGRKGTNELLIRNY